MKVREVLVLNKLLSGKISMKTSDFNFELPESFIAQNPAVPRDSSRLMVYGISFGEIFHERFSDIKKYLHAGDVIVLNKSRVIPARINFEINGNAKELFILRKVDDDVYHVMVRPGRYFKLAREFEVVEGLFAKVIEVLDDGTRMIKFSGDNVDLLLSEVGEMPLPPYIKYSQAVFDQYQTVYAKDEGSVAAPTAGLHFTEGLLEELRDMGVQIEEVILHVGRGTFLPVASEDIDKHVMHAEFYSIDEQTSKNLNLAVGEGRRVIAVGTTSVRVLESAYDDGFRAKTGETDIFIYPGSYSWKVVSGLITNFHLPKSTLLMLVASFLESKGEEKSVAKLLELYELAKNEGYRFYSFGDAMFLF